MQTSIEENKSIQKIDESNESLSTIFIPACEMSDPTSDSSEVNNSTSLPKNPYKRGLTPSVFRSITREQSKINLSKIIENIRKGYEYRWITKLRDSSSFYYFYSSINKFNPNDENYSIYVEESNNCQWTF